MARRVVARAFCAVSAAGMHVMTDIADKIVRWQIMASIEPYVFPAEAYERQHELADEDGPSNDCAQQEKPI